MRSLIAIVAAGAATTALVAAGSAAQAGHDHGHGHSETSIDEINHKGYIAAGGDTAFIKVEYTCPEGADAAMKVWLSQEQGDDYDNDHRGGHGSDNTVTGSGKARDLDCTDDSEKVYVEVDADDRAEWEKGDAEAKALIVSRSHDKGHDKGRGGSKYDKDFERSDVYLVEKSHR